MHDLDPFPPLPSSLHPFLAAAFAGSTPAPIAPPPSSALVAPRLRRPAVPDDPRRPRASRRPRERRPLPQRAGRGYTLIDILVVMVVAGLLAVLGGPEVMSASRALRLHLASQDVAHTLASARLYAVRYGAHVAVHFQPTGDGGYTVALYRDGDGDGVRNADIRKGVDPLVRGPRRIDHLTSSITFGFPPGPGPRDPDNPRRRIENLDDPIHFNRSNLASFGPRGTATPGTIYLTDGVRRLRAVRLAGHTGKIKMLRYEPDTEIWRRR
ncbi:MAG: GspH/FimT family pseudopilin [Acidobacteriota bacterium]